MNVSASTAKEWLEAGIINRDEYETLTSSPQAKYHAVPTEVDGIRFHSKKEAHRWSTLKILERAGDIKDLKRQVLFPLIVNSVRVCKRGYVADFQYIDSAGQLVVEDIKGYKGGAAYEIFKIKANLVLALYGIKVLET